MHATAATASSAFGAAGSSHDPVPGEDSPADIFGMTFEIEFLIRAMGFENPKTDAI